MIGFTYEKNIGLISHAETGDFFKDFAYYNDLDGRMWGYAETAENVTKLMILAAKKEITKFQAILAELEAL